MPYHFHEYPILLQIRLRRDHQGFSQEKLSKKMMEIAFAMGQDVKEISEEDAMVYVMNEIKRLSDMVGIPSGMCKDERVIFGNKI